MKKFYITLLLLLLLWAKVISIQAQTTDRNACNGNIGAANNLYEKAQFSQAVSLLEPCIKSGGLKAHLPDAYRIVAMCYLQMNDEKKTEEAMYKLLKVKPNYQLFPYNDPVEFTNVLNRFKVVKSLVLGVKTGFNYTLPQITLAKSIKPATIEIIGNASQFIGLSGDYFLKNQKMAITSWVTSAKYIFSEKHTFNSYEKLSYKQEQNMIDWGLEWKYFPFRNSKFNPHIGLGVASHIFRNGLSNIVYNNDFSATQSESSRNLKATANKILFGGILDAGITLHTGKAFLGFGVQYAYSFSNVLNADSRYNDIEYILTNQYVDSDVKMHYCNLYLNYSFPVMWRVMKSK